MMAPFQIYLSFQQFFADYLGVDDYRDPRVGAAFMTAMSAVLIHMLVAPELRNIVVPGFVHERSRMNNLIVRQVMAGLAFMKDNIAKEKAQDR